MMGCNNLFAKEPNLREVPWEFQARSRSFLRRSVSQEQTPYEVLREPRSRSRSSSRRSVTQEPTLGKVRQVARCRSRSSSRQSKTHVANMDINESKTDAIDTRNVRKEAEDDSSMNDRPETITPSKDVSDDEDSRAKDVHADSEESEKVEVESKTAENKQEEKYEDDRTIALQTIKNPTPCVHKCGYRTQVAAVIGSKKTPAEGMQSYCCEGCKNNAEHTLDCEHVELATLERTVYASVLWKGSMLDYIIVLPSAKNAEKVPVLLFLTGVGHIGWPQGIFNGGVELLTRNPDSQEFCIICPLPDYNMCSYYRELYPEPTWHVFKAALQRAQITCDVDLERLYCTGISMGGSGTWDLMSRYGKHFAACVPMCGNCPWEDRWGSYAPLPVDEVWTHLQDLPIRHYHVSSDRMKSPYYDFDYLARGKSVTKEDSIKGIVLPGVLKDTKLTSSKEVWGDWELWEIDGPMEDWPDWKDNHCIWMRAYHQAEYEIFSWLLKHKLKKSDNALRI